MALKIKRELILEGLNCADCAAKIEKKVNMLDDVSFASMNFLDKTLNIETEDADKIDKIIQEAIYIVKDLEPGVIVKEKIITSGGEKRMILLGLSCASCAAKIEKEVKNISGVKSASVDFASKKLSVEFANKYDETRIIKEVSKAAKLIEPDLEMVEENKDKEEVIDKKEIVRLALGAAIFVVGIVFRFSFWTELVLFLTSYVLVGGEIVLKAARNIAKGRVFDENFLMSVATIGAFAIQEFPEGVAVMLFYRVGELFQNLAVNRSRRSIKALMDIRPDYANLIFEGQERKVDPEEVKMGDIIIVKPGEKIPLDGEVIEGGSMVDTSALTGESVPREVEKGNEVLSGSINKNGLIKIKVAKEFSESTVAKILDLVQNASSKKAPTENFITKFARYYTPVVVFTALALALIPPLVIPSASFSDWIYRALVFLVISCPCALVISIPLGFFGGIGAASRNGVLVKGSNYLEALNSIHTLVFDKTGTLTKGVFKVTRIKTEESVSQGKLLEYAAYAESYSNHPIAVSIRKAYGREIDRKKIEKYDEISGQGTIVRVQGREIVVGNNKLMENKRIKFDSSQAAGTVVYVAINGKYAGFIVISDEIKDDSANSIKELKKMGVKKIVMLTGDSESVGLKVGRELGIDEIHAGLLPHQKVEKLEELNRQKPLKGKLAFVGDGLNDAPVLARADIGIAMGGLGSDAAIEAADVVLMTDEPSKLVSAINIAKRTRRIVWQNIIFALVVKVVVLLLGAGGIATMWEAVFADVGVTVIAVLNAMRIMNAKKSKR